MHSFARSGHLLACVVVIAILAVGCANNISTPTSTPEPQVVTAITIAGSGTVSSVLEAVTPAFEAANPGYTLNILSGSGTGGGVQGVMDGILHVAAMARPAKAEEIENGLNYVEIGQAGIAFIAHPLVTVDSLTQEQAVAILFGEVTNWSDVGGPDQDIVVYVRDEEETATQALRKTFLGDEPFPETTAAVLTSLGDMLASVEGTPGSIGFGTWPGIKARQSTARALNLDGKAPDQEGYPVHISLGVGYSENGEALAQVLLDFLNSSEGLEALQGLDVLVVDD